MACSKCEQRRQNASLKLSAPVRENVNLECEYDSETTNNWIGLLECAANIEILSDYGIQKALYNAFLGILISIKRNPASICYFKKELDIIQPYIINIINSGKC